MLPNAEAQDILGKYLLPDEKLIWSNKPQIRWWLEMRPYFPFITVFLLIFIFFVFSFLSDSTNKKSQPATAPQTAVQAAPSTEQHQEKPHLFGVLFTSAFLAFSLCFPLFFVFKLWGGPIFMNQFSLSCTCYGLTDTRLIIVSGRKEIRVLTYHLRTLQDFRLRVLPDGIGTIHFGQKEGPYKNPFQEDTPPLILKNISDASEVFNLIAQTQKKLLA